MVNESVCCESVVCWCWFSGNGPADGVDVLKIVEEEVDGMFCISAW